MALTATATQGFEFLRRTAPGEILWIPGDPGDTFTRGDIVTVTAGEGIVDAAAAAEAPIGRVVKTVTCPAATVGMPTPAAFDPVSDASPHTCLVGIEPFVPAGTPVYLATFAAQTDDENITAYTAGTPSLTTGSTGSDDDLNGALVYVYGGPGIGQVNVVADYANGTGVATLHRIFETALTTASDVIILADSSAASNGVGFFGRLDAADQNNLTVDPADAIGDFTVYLSYPDATKYLKNLKLPVIPSAALYTA
jgi:hypothetical protein